MLSIFLKYCLECIYIFFNRRIYSCNKGFKEKSEGFYKW